ncbi:MAG: hypothetical protein KBD50_02895 [Candidatus Pacebacteria bacterium]|nr:hypothetical protein [Candidatus Paceibacterota bacterium]
MSSGDLIPLALYLVQQLGIMLGVGSATVLLISYLVSMRDGLVENKEAQFSRVVQHVLEIGLVCIVLSGAIITAMHTMAGQYDIISSPAYFFKWILVAFVSVAIVMRRAKPFISSLGEGFVGATWYALFILHVVAPIAFWTDLLILYFVWVAGFMLLWMSLSKLITARGPVVAKSAPVAVKAALEPVVKTATIVLAPKPVPPPAPKMQQPAPPPVPKPAPKPPVPPVVAKPVPPPLAIKPILPVVAHAELAAPHVAAAPAPIKAAVPIKPPPPPAGVAPIKPKELVVAEHVSMPVPGKPEVLIKNTDDTDDIPHIYVMPRTPEDAEKHLRSTELQYT